MQYGADAEVAELGTELCPNRGDAWTATGAEGRQQPRGIHQAGQSPLPLSCPQPLGACWGALPGVPSILALGSPGPAGIQLSEAGKARL